MIARGRYADKIAAAVIQSQAAIARSTEALAAHNRTRPVGDDRAWQRQRLILHRQVEVDEAALAFAERRTGEARAATARAAEEKRVADDSKKLFHKFQRQLFDLTWTLTQMRESNARTATFNAKHAGQSPVDDAESRMCTRIGGEAALSMRPTSATMLVKLAGDQMWPPRS